MGFSKKLLRSILLLAFGILLVSLLLTNMTFASPYAVIKNPGFEMPSPSDWIFTTTNDPPDDFASIYPAPPHTGLASAGIDVLSAEPGDHAEWSQHSVSPVYADVSYNLSTWVFITIAPNLWVDIGVIWEDGAGTPLGSAFHPKENVPQGVWFSIWINLTAPPATEQVTLVLRVEVDEAIDAGQVYFDDVEFLLLDSISTIGDNSLGDHGSYFDPDADPFNEMLQINITAPKETLTQINFTLHAFGSADDSTDIAEIDLVYDQDGNGLYNDTTESILDSGTYSQDNGTLQLNATAHTIPQGQSHAFLIVYQLTFTSDAGETFGFNVTQIQAWSLDNLITVNLPGPLYQSAVKTTIGSLLAKAGVNTSSDHNWTPDGITPNALLQLDLFAYAENFSVQSITVEIHGTGNPSIDVSQMLVIHDSNNNGQIDAGEPTLISETGGTTQMLTFVPSFTVGKRTTEHLLIALIITTTATNTTTFSVQVTDIIAQGIVDSSTTVVNLPVTSAIKTIIFRPSITFDPELLLVLIEAVVIIILIIIVVYLFTRLRRK